MGARVFVIAAMAMLAGSLPPSAGAQMAQAFGPKEYANATGAAQTFVETFPHCGAAQRCQLVIGNGDNAGGHRIASASISLNGVEVAGPGDFNRSRSRIVKPVALVSINRLTIALGSQPGSFFTLEVECAAPPTTLSAGSPGANLLNTLATALPIINTGTVAAQNVTVTAIALLGGKLATPAVPLKLGTIAPAGSAVLNADFTGKFKPLDKEVLTVRGTYSAGSATYCFALSGSFGIPPPLGAATVGEATAAPHSVSGGRFPHQPLNFPDTVNSSRWTVPVAGATTFQTNPSGLRVSVDGREAQATPFGLTLSPGTHIISTAIIQAGSQGTRYVFTNWSDGGSASHTLNVGGGSGTYNATFATQHVLSTSTVPSGGGTIVVTPPSPDHSGYYESGTKVLVKAEPNSLHVFSGFGGALTGKANPQTITLTAPSLVVAKFTARER